MGCCGIAQCHRRRRSHRRLLRARRQKQIAPVKFCWAKVFPLPRSGKYHSSGVTPEDSRGMLLKKWKGGGSVNGCAGCMSMYIPSSYVLVLVWGRCGSCQKRHIDEKRLRIRWDLYETSLQHLNVITASQRYYSISTLLQQMSTLELVHQPLLQHLHVITASPRYYSKCNVHVGTSTSSRMKVLDRCRNENTTPVGIKTFLTLNIIVTPLRNPILSQKT
jgi:hypothetical protein